MSDFNIEFEENDQQITLEFESGVGGAVSSVNGMTGDVVLTASDVGALPTSTPIPTVDNTLTTAGAAADAKKTGDEIATVKDGFDSLQTDLAQTTAEALAAFVTDTASGAIASFPDGADGVPVKSLTVDIEPVQSGSGDPSPTNVRPISGHTSAVVTRTGKNLLNDQSTEIGTAWNGNGNSARARLVIPCLPSTTYVLSMNGSNGLDAIYYRNTPAVPAANAGSPATFPQTINTTANDHYIVLGFNKTSISQADVNALKLQLEIGATATAYESYQGQTVTIDLNGTRYGGTLNVETGVLTVDRAMVDLGTLNWTYSERYFYATTPYPVPVYNAYSAYANAICSAYRVEKFGTMYNNYSTVDKCFSINNGSPNDNVVRIRDTSYTDAASFKTAMSGVQLVYELATPQTVQLTANEISTVLGQNNIWNDCGDTEVEYRADTKLYIKKLTGSTEDDMVADANIVSGQYFMVGNTLYKATANIASGGAITPNVNCTRKSLPEALNEINA